MVREVVLRASRSGAHWQPFARDTASGSAAVAMGAGFCVVSAAVCVSTMWFLPHTQDLLPVAAVDVAVAAVALLLAHLHQDVVLPSRRLLAYPALIYVAVLATAVVSRSVGGAYIGLLTIGFIYVGFTQTRGTAVWLIPLVVPLWWYCQPTSAVVSAVKLPISVTIWLIVGEVLAFSSHSVRSELDRLTGDAATDVLTGLGNRRALEAALSSIEAGDEIVVIDVDRFKAINDTLGHEAGDRVLSDFAGTLRAALRSGDQAFRFGGEEMVVILRRGAGTAASASSMLERLRNRWASDDRPTFSAGACVHVGGSPAETMKLADDALYEAKKSGRDRWVEAGRARSPG